MRICKVDGCERKHDAKGYCKKHYLQIYKHGKIFKRTNRDPNEIIVKNNIAEVVLYNRKNKEVARTIIDTEDVEKVKKYKWCLTQRGYVVTNIKGKIIGIQHIISGVKSTIKAVVDHKDRNKLNNRKFNFRHCTQKQNSRNGIKHKDNTSGYKGVIASGAGWVAQIGVNERVVYLGTFNKKMDAALAYNQAAIKHFGEFACLNEV